MKIPQELQNDVTNAIQKAKDLKGELEYPLNHLAKEPEVMKLIEGKDYLEERHKKTIEIIQSRVANKNIVLENLLSQEEERRNAYIYMEGKAYELAYCTLLGIEYWLDNFIEEIQSATEEYYEKLSSYCETTCESVELNGEELANRIVSLEPDFAYKSDVTVLVYEFLNLLNNVPLEYDSLKDPDQLEAILAQMEVSLSNLTDFVKIGLGTNPYTDDREMFELMQCEKLTKNKVLDTLFVKVN